MHLQRCLTAVTEQHTSALMTVAVMFPRQTGVARHNPSIVHDNPFFVCVWKPTFLTPVHWVPVVVAVCLITIVFGKLFAAMTVFHAGALRVELTAWPMHVAGCDSFVQLWEQLWVWNLSTNNAVVIVGGCQVVFRGKY